MYVTDGLTVISAQLFKFHKWTTVGFDGGNSLFSLGHSFHIAAQLGGDVTAVFNRIEDAVVQSDEVDGKYLQFEGGLSITGIYIF